MLSVFLVLLVFSNIVLKIFKQIGSKQLQYLKIVQGSSIIEKSL